MNMEHVHPDNLFRPKSEFSLEDVVSATRAVLQESGDVEALAEFNSKLSDLETLYAERVKLASDDYARREQLNREHEATVRELTNKFV